MEISATQLFGIILTSLVFIFVFKIIQGNWEFKSNTEEEVVMEEEEEFVMSEKELEHLMRPFVYRVGRRVEELRELTKADLPAGPVLMKKEEQKMEVVEER